MIGLKEFVKAKKINEDKVVVIHTKGGKVDYIEKGEMVGGRLIRDAGVDFKDFVGMDPNEAKNSLVKFSRFDPKSIIIEGCKKVQEATPAVKVGSKIRVKNGATSWEAEVVKVNPDGKPLILKSIRSKSPDFGKEYKGSWDEYEVIEEADVPTSKRELYSKAKIGFNGLKKRLDDILSLVEKGEYKFVSSFLDDVATSCQRMAKAYDDADRMDKAGKMTD